MNGPDNILITWKVEQCCSCGVPFAMTKETYENYLSNGRNFYCPNGHQQHYTESCSVKLGKLQGQINNLNDRLVNKNNLIEHLNRSKRTLKGHITRLKQ